MKIFSTLFSVLINLFKYNLGQAVTCLDLPKKVNRRKVQIKSFSLLVVIPEKKNLFLVNFPNLCALKLPWNQRFSGGFRGYKMRTLTRFGLKVYILLRQGKVTPKNLTQLFFYQKYIKAVTGRIDQRVDFLWFCGDFNLKYW